jgi:hypothetical protein
MLAFFDLLTGNITANTTRSKTNSLVRADTSFAWRSENKPNFHSSKTRDHQGRTSQNTNNHTPHHDSSFSYSPLVYWHYQPTLVSLVYLSLSTRPWLSTFHTDRHLLDRDQHALSPGIRCIRLPRLCSTQTITTLWPRMKLPVSAVTKRWAVIPFRICYWRWLIKSRAPLQSWIVKNKCSTCCVVCSHDQLAAEHM